jgi:uncharacterized protein (UPF0303 family)
MAIADDLTIIAQQEKELELDRFNEEQAWTIGSQLRELALARKYPALVIDLRRFGQQLFYAAVGEAIPDHAEWIRRKNNVVARFHCSSYAMGLKMRQKNTTLCERYGLPIADYAEHGGGFPLRVAGAGVIGSVTVSGLVQREDHELVVEALCLLTGRDYGMLTLPTE